MELIWEESVSQDNPQPEWTDIYHLTVQVWQGLIGQPFNQDVWVIKREYRSYIGEPTRRPEVRWPEAKVYWVGPNSKIIRRAIGIIDAWMAE
jgi:hypothetical protein